MDRITALEEDIRTAQAEAAEWREDGDEAQAASIDAHVAILQRQLDDARRESSIHGRRTHNDRRHAL